MSTAPQAVRLEWGVLHLAGATGRGYRAVCGRTLQQTEEGPDLVVYIGRDVGKAWRLEVVCRDCDRKLQAALNARGRGRVGAVSRARRATVAASRSGSRDRT